MDDKKLVIPKINWFGGYLVARDLLSWTKGGIEDQNDPDHFVSKMNRFNFIDRVFCIMGTLNSLGPTLEAAQAIQAGGNGFFTEIPAEALAVKLEESVSRLTNGGVWKFSPIEFGTLDFSEQTEK